MCRAGALRTEEIMPYLKLIAQTAVVGKVLDPVELEISGPVKLRFDDEQISLASSIDRKNSLTINFNDSAWVISDTSTKLLKNDAVLPTKEESHGIHVAFEKVKKCLGDCLERFQAILGFSFQVDKEVQTFKEYLEVCERYEKKQLGILEARQFLQSLDVDSFEICKAQALRQFAVEAQSKLELKRKILALIDDKKASKILFLNYAEEELSAEQLSHFSLMIENHQRLAESKPPVSLEATLMNIQSPIFDTLDEAYFYFRERLSTIKEMSRLSLGDVFQVNNWQVEVNYQALKGNEETPLSLSLTYREIDEFIHFASRDKNLHQKLAAYLEEQGDSSEQAKLALHNEFKAQQNALRDIIRKHGRILTLDQGSVSKPQVLCRQGDYGNTAYYIASGSLQIVLDDHSKNKEQHSASKKTWMEAFSQLFSPTRHIAEAQSKQSDSSKSFSLNGEALFMMDMDGVFFDDENLKKESGEILGEISAMGRTPRMASIVATEEVTVLELRWQGLRDLRERLPIIRDITDASFSKHGLDAHLRATQLFKHLHENEEAFTKLKEATEYRRFGDFSWHGSFKAMLEQGVKNQLENEPLIIREGEYPDGLFLIRSGFVRVSQVENNGHKTLSYLGKGAVYGLDELKHNFMNPDGQKCHHYSVRSLGYTDVIFVPKEIVEELLFKDQGSEYYCPNNKTQKLEISFEVTETLKDGRSGLEINQDLADALVDKRVINGTSAMMINLDRCTRCDDCVVACADAHDGNPRFVRHGEKALNFMIANACMHCNDPVCMIGCPTGAIHREQGEGQVTINDSTCIGCATCANGCPYNNIRMVDFPGSTTAIPKKATKCDLCYDQLGGPSCERACPHEALVRVNVSNSTELEGWFKINEGRS